MKEGIYITFTNKMYDKTETKDIIYTYLLSHKEETKNKTELYEELRRLTRKKIDPRNYTEGLKELIYDGYVTREELGRRIYFKAYEEK